MELKIFHCGKIHIKFTMLTILTVHWCQVNLHCSATNLQNSSYKTGTLCSLKYNLPFLSPPRAWQPPCYFLTEFPCWLSNKKKKQTNKQKTACLCRRREFDPWVGKIPWRKVWQPISVFLPVESHGQRSLVGYSPWDHKALDMTEQLNNQDNEFGYSRYLM